MKCPFCGKEMACGYLHNHNQPVQWIPKGERPSGIAYTTAEKAVKLNNTFSFFKTGGYSTEAFYCDTCRIIIAQTEEQT